MKCIGVGGWVGGWVAGSGVGGKPKVGNTIRKVTNSSVVSSVGHRNCLGRDSRQQQFDTQSSFISGHQWPHRSCSGPSWFYRVSNRPPVKADLAIYSIIVGMSGQWLNVMLSIKLDFYCCNNSVGFCKSSHILFGYDHACIYVRRTP